MLHYPPGEEGWPLVQDVALSLELSPANTENSSALSPLQPPFKQLGGYYLTATQPLLLPYLILHVPCVPLFLTGLPLDFLQFLNNISTEMGMHKLKAQRWKKNMREKKPKKPKHSHVYFSVRK